jgi:SAM-dependent methyltransferase
MRMPAFFFLSTEVPLRISATAAPPPARWMQIVGSGISRPALVLSSGETAAAVDPVQVVAGSRLLVRYGAALEALSADGATLRIELARGQLVHVVAELSLPGGPAGCSVHEAQIALDAWPAGDWEIRLDVGPGPLHDPTADWVAIYELAVAPSEELPVIAARAFATERTANELAHFASVYDHEMYHGDASRHPSRPPAKCRMLQDLAREWSLRDDATQDAPAAFPSPDRLSEALRDPFHYTHHLLSRALHARAPDFHGRLAALAAKQTVRILSLCSGAARIEASMATLAGPAAHWTLMDLNESLLQSAAANFPEGVEPELVAGDLNRIRDFGERFDVILCVSGLHHIVELESVLAFIDGSLADNGEFWSIGEAIGRNGNRLWGRDLAAANACFQALPARLRFNHHTGTTDASLPDDDYGSGTFEGIRSQDIMPLLLERLDPVDLYRRNCFLWRLVNQAYSRNYDMADAGDVERLQGFVRAEVAHFRNGGRPTELHGIFRKRMY